MNEPLNKSQASGSSRRQWLIGGGLGLAAGALGVYVAQRRQQNQPLSPQAQAFWSARFDQAGGGDLLPAPWRGKPLLLNFWATWCAPCVKELPEIDQFQREFAAQGWQVLGLAVDAPTPVREFLKKVPVSFPIGMAGLTGTDLARTLGNTQGGLPFSVAFGPQGEPIWRKLGATSLPELREMALAAGKT
jgi:thiol-disulfide isomerase/thioredoxin